MSLTSITSADIVAAWDSSVRHVLNFEEPEELDGALVSRSVVRDEETRHHLSPALRRCVDAADREFLRIRPTLVERFPDVFDPILRHATEEEWWWWPDRVPAELANSHPQSRAFPA